MNILILGGTGFISGALVRRLLTQGHHVTTITRGRIRIDARGGKPEQLTADRANVSALRQAIGHRTFDAVYDIIAYRPEDSQSAIEVFRGITGRFIHCSTISVYMVADEVDSPVTEDQDSRPLMKYWDRNPFGMQYGIDKRECERVLWDAHQDTHFPVSMLRPTFVSGPADPAGRDWFWIERVMDGKPLLVPGSGDYRFQQVFIDDVANAFAALLDHDVSIGKAYNVAAEEMFTLNNYLEMLGELTGHQVSLEHLPQPEFDELPLSTNPRGDVFPFNVRRTATFSLDRIKNDLGYHSTPIREWMATTIDWWYKKGVHSLGYESRAEELALIRARGMQSRLS